MSDIITSFADEILNHFFGNALAFATLGTGGTYPDSTFWVGLSSTLPADDGTNITEPTGGAYARVETTNADWNIVTPRTMENATLIHFPKATADWLSGVNLPYFVLFDALTAGTPKIKGAITVPKKVLTNDTLKHALGALKISVP